MGKPKPQSGTLFRQGDVFLQRISQLPSGLPRLAHGVLAHGEITGHSHRLADTTNAVMYAGDRELLEHFVEVTRDDVQVIHEEHGPITLAPGVYRIWRQREYTPERIVRVAD